MQEEISFRNFSKAIARRRPVGKSLLMTHGSAGMIKKQKTPKFPDNIYYT
jgi:hypothetical protein